MSREDAINKLKEKFAALFDWALDDGVEKLLPEPILGPFSGLSFDDISAILDFVRDVDSKHGLGVEALDVIIGDIKFSEKHKKPFSAREAIFHASCEWDL